MKITVRCFMIPADVTFDTEDVCKGRNPFAGSGHSFFFSMKIVPNGLEK